MMTSLVILWFGFFLALANCYESVKEPPIAQRKRDYKIVPLGEDIELLCPIHGHPQPEITWSKGSETITDYAWERFSLDKKSLKISQVQYDDTGIYVCKGINGFGSADVRMDLFVIDKEAYAQGQHHKKGIPPKLTEEILQMNKNLFPKTGTNLYLTCTALGQPIPTIYWLKNGVNIDHSDGILELTNIDTNDNAMYTCLAQNIRGEVSKNFSVSVVSDHVYIDESNNQGSYLPDYNTITHLVVPNNPQNTTVEQKGRAVLECKTKGESTWVKKLRQREILNLDANSEIINLKPESFLVIKQSSRQQLESFQDQNFFITRLIIRDVVQADAGTYYCVDLKNSNFKYTNLLVKAESDNSKDTSTDPLILVVACLGAFVLVFLILIIVCIFKRNEKPNRSNQSVETPEIREKMLDQHVQVRSTLGVVPPPQPSMEAFQHQYNPTDFYTQKWINHPKMGQPLPPTPLEDHRNHAEVACDRGIRRYHPDSNDLTKPRGSYRR